MPRFDLSLEELQGYRPVVAEPDDFDAFWATTIAESRRLASATQAKRVVSPFSGIDVLDVTFSGFAGDQIKAWLLLPADRGGPVPAVVEYVGYGGGRGLPHERLAWCAAGYAYLVMDTRGQGGSWGSGGDTPDPQGSGPAAPGAMTRGIDDPAGYYYRRLYTDAVRAVDAVRSFDAVDRARVAVCGGSQGGGIAIAVAGLVPDLVGVMPDVPFLSHFERAVGMTGAEPYAEVARYLAVRRGDPGEVFRTLSYFDGVNFARRAVCPALYSVGLLDPICPPSTVFASFNHYAGEAEIEIYPFNEHEGGGAHQWPRQAAWLARILA